ncbi:MAG: sulfite exporter TauE/SafE family protein [Cytophagales bacterium]|nr:MAG: sulfite exporter TauE/SafE family protein [Cytophagales bacterium]
MEIIGYVGALFMGLSLGLIGGGGSILTVPILVYLFAVDPVLATSYSLFIVGLTSLVGSASHISQGNIHWRTAFVFGLPSIIGVYLTRLYVVPIIPREIGEIGDFIITKPLFLLMLFAVIMLLASISMIKKPKKELLISNDKLPMANEQPTTSNNLKQSQTIEYNYPLILVEGLVVGGITGLVGAGGGFLIIPALVLLAKLPMKQAIGTSLIVIALKSLIGFTGDLSGKEIIDWQFLLAFASIAIVGIVAGSFFAKKISNEILKPAFGWFVLVMGIYIIVKELFLK